MKKHRYLNKATGEIIITTSYFSAALYFERDAHEYGYKFSPADLVQMDQSSGGRRNESAYIMRASEQTEKQ